MGSMCSEVQHVGETNPRSAAPRIGAAAFVLVLGLAIPVSAAEYRLTFEERDRYEQQPQRGSDLLQVWVEGKKVYESNIQSAGPLWRESVPFSAGNPQKVNFSFRLALSHYSAADPEMEIGNLRAYDGRGGEMMLRGRWTSFATDPWFMLHRWSLAPLPAFRDGFAVRRAYGVPPKDDQQYAEWQFEGALVPAVNLQLRRLYEFPGCYGELGFYDDWKKVRFDPARPKAGQRVAVTAMVHNAGALDAQGAKVTLSVDGKVVETKTVDVPAVADAEVVFDWTATDGFHGFLVRAEPQAGIAETRSDDNWLLRTLVVGDARKAHPYLLFRPDYLPKLKKWLSSPPPWYASYYQQAKDMSGYVQPDEKGRFEETSAIVASNNAFLALTEPEFRPLIEQGATGKKEPAGQSTRERAIAFLKTVWDLPRGWFSDAPCAMTHYAQAYDWVASTLSVEEDRDIRARMAKAMTELVLTTSSGLDLRAEKPTPGQSYYPPRQGGRKNLRGYSQGTYIDACAIVVGALAMAGEEEADGWLHFGLNAIDEEILREMTNPHGYYREGHGYMGMAEDRSGACCWLALAQIGVNPFGLWPQVEKMHEIFLRDRMPNGWCPSINDSRAVSALPQVLYASLYADAAVRAAARWDWKNQVHTQRGLSPDAHYGNLFLLTDTPEADGEPAAPPSWTPSQFLGDYLVFRSNWSPDAAYLCLNTKHFPSTSASHDQCDKNSFLMYAKKAYLAVDPGYGNTAGRSMYGTVCGWCRGEGNPFNQNMVTVDGKRPLARRRSPFSYFDSPFPENTFATDCLDFGEAALTDWFVREVHGGRPTGRRALIDHRRSILFVHATPDPAFHYFIVADTLADRLAEFPHTFGYVLNGNSRRPYYGAAQPGDFVNAPPNERAVPKADNLAVGRQGGGTEARWTVANSDGKDVVFRAFFAAPAPEDMTLSTGDGWLGYARPIGRNKYLEAKVENRRNIAFLTLLYPDLVDDPRDDVKLERIGHGRAKMTFADGRAHVVLMRPASPVSASEPKPADGHPESDADIAFWELDAAGNANLFFLARGTRWEADGKKATASGRLETLTLDLRRPDGVRGYLSASSEVTLQLRLGATFTQATFNGRPVPVQNGGGNVVLSGLQGSGDLWLRN